MIVNLFAGPGGWCEGLHLAGSTDESIGFDNSPDACATARKAGHRRVLTDLTAYPPARFTAEYGPVDGVIGSPVCKSWSVANMKRLGLGDARGRLIEIPLRWVRELRPRWTAWEITPKALPVFEEQAWVLRREGYGVWTGILAAEEYGVPSTRRRAILMARRGAPIEVPQPTVLKAVSMGEALGLEDDGRVLVSNYGTGGDPKRRGRRGLHQPAFTITGKCGRNVWEWPDGRRRNLTVAEAGVLNGFRADYPWQGGSISRQQQVGDAVPPPLAAAILRPLLAALSGSEAAA